MEIYLQLFGAFFRIGGLTFGGGLTQLPMLKYEIVQKYHWLEEEELLDIFAIGQCTPGIIAINTATYVGYKKAGVAGGISATLGMVMPSLIIITLAAAVLQVIIRNVWVQHALMGIRAVVCALMLNTVLTMGKKVIKGRFAAAVAAAAFLVAFLTRTQANARSLGKICSLCRLESTINTVAASSSISRTMTGTSVRPAACAAWTLR